MNNKFSDIDKAIITAWLFFGAGVGAFVSPLFRVSFFMGGVIGLFLGASVAYVLFFEPWRKRHGIFSSLQVKDDSVEMEDERSDISEFIRDSFEAEEIDSDAEVEFTPAEGDPEEEDLQDEADEDDPEEDTAIDLEEESEESDDEVEESDEELELEDEEYGSEDESLEEDPEEENDGEWEEQSMMPAFYARSDQIHSSYDEYQHSEPRGLRAWLTPTQLPITLAGVWFFTSAYIAGNYPEIIRTIAGGFPIWFFTILPIFFLIGLSGLIGILFRERDETLEISTQENAAYLLNLLKILIGWGAGVYALLVNV